MCLAFRMIAEATSNLLPILLVNEDPQRRGERDSFFSIIPIEITKCFTKD
jgi:hypothetical protein